MKFLLLLLPALLLANEVEFDFYSYLHSEGEYRVGKSDNINQPSDKSGFSSWYNNTLVDYIFLDDFYLSLGGKTNYVFGEQKYQVPSYLRLKLSSDEINKAIFTEISFNYDNDFFTFNAGRMDVKYDWLSGSIDGAIAMIGDEDDLSFRVFYLENYTDLQYNYYVDFQHVNEELNFYGAIGSYNSDIIEFSLYDYIMPNLRNIVGTHGYLAFEKVGFNFAATYSSALQDAVYNLDESFYTLSGEYLYKNNFFELGGSYTGENGLIAMLQLGSFMFGQFYLSNQVDRPNAKNIYTRYIKANRKFRFEVLGGYTSYKEEIENKSLSSYEIDTYLTYAFNKKYKIEFGAMYMGVDQEDPFSMSQALLTTNFIYHYHYE